MGEDLKSRSNRRLAILLVCVILLMLGLSFAAVPFYSLFCRATGYGGTVSRAEAPATKILNRHMMVRFDSAVNPQLPWRFRPDQESVDLRIGETSIVSYHAQNMGPVALTGTATYNVQPDKIGKYFVKIQCFCFTEQHLNPGESTQLPVMFYIDPKIADDPDMDDVTTVTLSYTFFKADSKALSTAIDEEGK
jgi:cytochrome c oxidase assembly protein subunit 11